MIQHHKYSLTEIENMMPWERDVYVALLKQYIEEENLKRQQSKITYGDTGCEPWSPFKSAQIFTLKIL